MQPLLGSLQIASDVGQALGRRWQLLVRRNLLINGSSGSTCFPDLADRGTAKGAKEPWKTEPRGNGIKATVEERKNIRRKTSFCD